MKQHMQYSCYFVSEEVTYPDTSLPSEPKATVVMANEFVVTMA
jgi:hypothetical protein